jgi:hypothetical protein
MADAAIGCPLDKTVEPAVFDFPNKLDVTLVGKIQADLTCTNVATTPAYLTHYMA